MTPDKGPTRLVIMVLAWVNNGNIFQSFQVSHLTELDIPAFCNWALTDIPPVPAPITTTLASDFVA